MPTYVALLRAVNVGGRGKLDMRTLRELCGALGFTEVQTYIQSGNVVFGAPAGKASTLEATISAAIARSSGLDVAVLVRTAREMTKIMAANPFVGPGADPRRLHVTFLARRPPAGRVRDLDPEQFAPDVFAVAGREVYLHTPNGVGQSKLGGGFFERVLAMPTTTRNWNTVTKLCELAT